MFRSGDMVFNERIEEDWLLAFGDLESGDGKVAPCGWPGCLANASDCTLLTAATDEEHMDTLRAVSMIRDSDFRSTTARRYLESLQKGRSDSNG